MASFWFLELSKYIKKIRRFYAVFIIRDNDRIYLFRWSDAWNCFKASEVAKCSRSTVAPSGAPFSLTRLWTNGEKSVPFRYNLAIYLRPKWGQKDVPVLRRSFLFLQEYWKREWKPVWKSSKNVVPAQEIAVLTDWVTRWGLATQGERPLSGKTHILATTYNQFHATYTIISSQVFYDLTYIWLACQFCFSALWRGVRLARMEGLRDNLLWNVQPQMRFLSELGYLSGTVVSYQIESVSSKWMLPSLLSPSFISQGRIEL